MTTVIDVLTYPIKPEHIDTTSVTSFMGSAFNKLEREISARWIVRFCQSRGSWEPFTREELEAFYRAGGHDDGFRFNGLSEDGNIQYWGGHYHLTHTFIVTCFAVSPAANLRP